MSEIGLAFDATAALGGVRAKVCVEIRHKYHRPTHQRLSDELRITSIAFFLGDRFRQGHQSRCRRCSLKSHRHCRRGSPQEPVNRFPSLTSLNSGI